MKIIHYVGQNGCSAKSYQDAIQDLANIVINTFDQSNVTLRANRDGRPIRINVSPTVRDLLGFAISVYIADEHLSRNETPDGWTRAIDFIIPVGNPSSWISSQDVLTNTLNVLSGDNYVFKWEKCDSIPKQKKHRSKFPKNFDLISLFSGGLDSFLGVYQALSKGKKVILVSHQADPIAASTQVELARYLKLLFPGNVTLIQCRVARSQTTSQLFSLPKKNEETHRSRSFLFLCLAIAVASASDTQAILIPENGLIALNVPLQLSRMGTLSTRTAHPLYLKLFIETVKQLGAFTGHIHNPFLYQSKTDILTNVPENIKPLLLKTVSCSHPDVFRWSGVSKKRHCGYCVPCIYRRIAMAGIGIDNPANYVTDVFTSLKLLSPAKQADLRALVSFSKRVLNSCEAERQMMLLQHGIFPYDIGGVIGPYAAKDFSPWSDMLRRWAKDFLEKTKSWSSESTKRILSL